MNGRSKLRMNEEDERGVMVWECIEQRPASNTPRQCEEAKGSSSREKERKRIGAPANLVPSVGSVASESNESLVTLREEITAEGSLDFHGS